MLLKLSSPTLTGDPIGSQLIKKMVDFYRANRRKDSSSLKFVHFPMTEMIQLLQDNNIIGAITPQDQNRIRSYGVKLYMANHANDPNSCPSGNTAYLDKDTVVVCVTQLVPVGGYQTWVDLLENDATVSIPGNFASMGLDKSTICPPDCPTTNNHDNVDISLIP